MGIRRRPGLEPVLHLPQDVRNALEPLLDVTMRITGTSLPKLKPLPTTATLVDLIKAYNALLSRIQED